MKTRTEYIKSILPSVGEPKHQEVSVFAPINIALIKYWGKRDKELMLPYNASLSLTLNHLGTETKLSIADEDRLSINGEMISSDSEKHKKAFDFLHLIAGNELKFALETRNNIPTASGLASSASAFASFSLALNELFGWSLSAQNLSRLARIGSVSAGRSLHRGFVLMGNNDECTVTPIKTAFDDLCIGFCIVSGEEKKHKSRDNMAHTVSHSVFYESWLQIVHRDLAEIIPSIEAGDFQDVGRIAERNALSMHASIAMLNEPDRVYLREDSLALLSRVQKVRREGLSVFATVDAGPNVKLLFQDGDISQVRLAFPEMNFHERIF